jgi:hypothetical protein
LNSYLYSATPPFSCRWVQKSLENRVNTAG